MGVGMEDTENPTESSASDILLRAAAIVRGARNVLHGEKERSFAAIAEGWNWYLGSKKSGPFPITPRDVAEMMAILKMARSVQGVPTEEHFLDQAGYSGIAGELAALESP